MKKDIHPEYVECTVSCACGNTFISKSNKPEIKVDICNACHPFFTGSEKIVISVTAIGATKNRKISSRSNAKIGYKIIVSGNHGSSGAGLKQLEHGIKKSNFINSSNHNGNNNHKQ